MPILTDGVIKRQGQVLEEYTPSFSEYAGAKFDQAIDFNPMNVIGDSSDLNEALNETVNVSPAAAFGGVDLKITPKLRMSEMEIKDKADAAGVEINIPKEGLTGEAVDMLIARRRRQNKQNDIINRSEFGTRSAAGFGIQLGASFLDPLNIGLAFVPVIGPARYEALLMKQSGKFGRAALRAKVGTAEGIAGIAAFEPINYKLHRTLQDDYSALDSLINIGFGGVLGGGLHVGGGLIRDAYLGKWWKPSIKPAEPAVVSNGVYGAKTQIKIGEGYEPAKWAVIDSENLQATMSKADNQFRDRTRTASDSQVRDIANKIDFNLLAESPVMDLGAPTLSKDGLVIGGNGRVAAIDLAHNIGTGQRYTSDLKAALNRFGIDPEAIAGMKRPALVRILDNDVDVRAAAIASNEGTALRMSSLEQAKVDAERLGNFKAFEINDTGDLNTAANRRFIKSWIQEQPINQRSALMDADGFLSVEGQARLKNSILFKAYGDSPTLGRLIESTDPGSKNIANALVRSAGRVAEAQEAIKAGDLHNIDIAPDIAQAVEKLDQLRTEKTTVNQFMAQGDLIGSGMSADALDIMRFMSENIRSPKAISDFVNNYYQALADLGNPKQMDVFGAAIPGKDDLLKSALAVEKELTAADIVAQATPQQREAALRTTMGQLMDGKVVEVEPIFTKPIDPGAPGEKEAITKLESVKEQVTSPEAVRVASREASEVADEKITTAPKSEALVDAEASLAKTLADLDEQVKVMDLGGNDAGSNLFGRVNNDFEAIATEYAALNNKKLGLTSENGRILNTDLMREMAPEYRADRTRSADVHEAASAAVKKLYAQKLAQPTPKGFENTVLFTGGGTGAGKSTGLELLAKDLKKAEIIYDTNMNGVASSIKKIEQALSAGREVQIVYTYRDPVEALINGALPRAERMGRTVPLKEHAKTHIGSNKAIIEIAEKYKNHPMVNISVIDNSLGKGKAKVIMLDKLKRLDDNADLLERLTNATEEKFKSGEISESTYNGTVGRTTQAEGGESGPGNRNSSQSESITRELKQYDDAIKSAEQLSLAARAAAICDLRA